MKNKKQTLVGSAVVSLIITAILAISLTTFLKGELGENVKYAYLALLIVFPILFLIFIPVINISGKRNKENQIKVETLKRIIETIKDTKEQHELISLQTTLAKMIVELPVTPMTNSPYFVYEILTAFDKKIMACIDRNAIDSDINITHTDMIKAFSRMISIPRNEKLLIAIGHAAYEFGGYSFMRQLAAYHTTQWYDSQAEEVLKAAIDAAWNEVEDWRNNKS